MTSLEQYIESFINYILIERGYSRHTAAAYRADLVQFLAFVGNGKQQKADGADLFSRQQLLAYVRSLPEVYAQATVHRKMATVKSFCRFLYRRGILNRNVAAEIAMPAGRQALPKAITLAEMMRLLAQPLQRKDRFLALRDKAILEMLYATGMRVSELTALQLNDLSLPEKRLRCRGKGGRERVLFLHDMAVQSVQAYLAEGRPHFLKDAATEALFLSRRGKRLSRQGVWGLVKRYSKEAGITTDVTPHTFRHSMATHMLNGGAGLREIQEMLGHASLTTTQIYTHVDSRRLRAVYDKTHPRA